MADNSKHVDEKKLKELHESQGRKSCFWKHPYGKSKESELLISASEYDSHVCHYGMNSFLAARGREDIHNTRHGKTNRERAFDKGYLEKDANNAVTVNSGTDYFLTDIGLKAGKKREPTFQARFEAKYNKSLFWLALNEKGWDVKFRIAPEDAAKNTTDIYRRHQQKDAQGNKQQVYVLSDLSRLARGGSAKLGGKGPENFAILMSQAHRGLGGWYPYDHEHHHLISADAFEKFIMSAPSSAGWTYMQRAAVVMQAGWNLHNADNMLLLPSETFAADVLDLPAHCPWESPDHPEYTRDLNGLLAPVQKKVDEALLKTKDDPEHKITEAMAQEIRSLLMRASRKAKNMILEKGSAMSLK
ncbi:AHH domain-containing protein [Corallococcus sicarius]|uniref:Uncharacterized protein n=1 Tax=Corallococcus sicarius TaxID=2316726 RepID=A0A3A8MGZ3_9BACT|nr:AHH domain-containing protein [Corallococcus sicarius]RKH28741.1 hypothetical protein D7X12_40015 [Corallococcus sicarius]